MALGGDLYRMTKGGKATKTKKEKKQEEATKKIVTQRQETRKTNAEKPRSVVYRTTAQEMEYTKKGYKGKSGDEGTKSYKWEKDILHKLPKSYGRSYNAKFDTWATNDLGFSKQEAVEFRTWLDSKEDVNKTRKRKDQKGYKELEIKSKNSEISDMIDTAEFKGAKRDKRVAEAFTKNDKAEAKKAKADKAKAKKKDETERDGVLGFLDKTVGRASRSANELVFGKDFVDKQDEVYNRNATARGDKESLKQTNVVSREAQSKLEKGADIAGMGLGIASYIAPGAASYKAAGAMGNLAKLTKGGSKAAEVLSKSPYALEAVRGATAGTVFEAANQGMREAINPDEFNGADHWKRIGLGAVAGAAGDVATRAIGQGFKALKNVRADKANVASGVYGPIKETLPSYTGQPGKAAMDSITPAQTGQATKDLVDGSVNRFSQSQKQLDSVLSEMKAARQTGSSSPMPAKHFEGRLDKAVAQSREEAIQSQFEYLKQNMKKGTEGGTTTNLFGEIDGTFTVSKNEGWYQDIYRQNGNRPPSQKQLKELAVEQVDNGFIDSVGNIPAWRPQQLDDLEQQIAQYTKIIAEQPEQTPAILPLLQAAEEDYTSLLASFNKVKPQAKPQIMDMPSQTASNDVLRASDVPEGILSQDVPIVQNEPAMNQIEQPMPQREVRQTVSDDLVPIPKTQEEYAHNINRLEEYAQKIEGEKAQKSTKKEREKVDRVIKRVQGSIETNKQGLESLNKPKEVVEVKKGRPKKSARSKLSELERNETPLQKTERLINEQKAKVDAEPTAANKAKLEALEKAYARQSKSNNPTTSILNKNGVVANDDQLKSVSDSELTGMRDRASKKLGELESQLANTTDSAKRAELEQLVERGRKAVKRGDDEIARRAEVSAKRVKVSESKEPSASFKTDDKNIIVKVSKGHTNEQQMTERLKAEGYKYIKAQDVWKKPNNRTQRGKMKEIADELGGNIEAKKVQFMRMSAPVRQPNPNAKVKPITERELKANIVKKFDIPIRTGNMNVDGDVKGLYKVRAEEIRTQKHNDIPVMAHELGHHLDKQFNFTKNLPSQYSDELMELGARTSGDGYSDADVQMEGLAEFVRLKMTDDAAAKKFAPNFYKMFDNRLDKKTLKAFKEVKGDIDRWIDQGSVNQFKAKIEKAGNVKSGKKLSTKTYEQFFDSNHMLKVMEKDLDGQVTQGLFGKTKTTTNSAEKSIHKQAQMSAGAPRKAQLHIDKEFKPIFKKAEKAGIPLDDLRAYSAAKHAQELEYMGINAGRAAVNDAKTVKTMDDLDIFSTDYGIKISKAQSDAVKNGEGLTLTKQQLQKLVKENHIESGFSQKQIKSVLNQWENNPAMIAAHKEIVDYNDALLKMLVDSGMASKEGYHSMRRKYPDYVPFNRFFDEDLDNAFTGASNGFVDISNPIKRLKGSTRNIVDPLESMVRNTFNIIDKIEKNKVGQQLARLSDLEGAAKWVTKLDGTTADGKENIVTVWQNGVKEQYQVNKDVYGALKGLDDNGANIVLTVLSKPTGWIRAGATLTPDFMVKNPIRDQFSAYVNSDSGYNPFIDLPRGLYSVISGKMKLNNKAAQNYYDWINEGGAFGGYLSQDRDYLSNVVKDLQSGGIGKNAVKYINPKTWAKGMLEALQLGSELMEEGTKLGEFQKAIKKGATPQEAAFRSRDLMDFSRAGTAGRQANKIIPFLNANIQGKDKLARSFIEHPVRTTTKALVGVSLPTVGAYMLMEHTANDVQKEKWANVPQWKKDTAWIVPIPGTDELGAIPKPFDLAPLFANPVELTMDYMKEKEPEAWSEFVKRNGASLATLPMTMAAISPSIENMTNYDFFTKASVVPEAQKDDLPEDQYGANTSFVARVGGNVTKTSPYKWDNFITGHFGGLGQYGLDIVDAFTDNKVVREATGIEIPSSPAKKWTEQPGIKALTVNDRGGGKVMTDFYNRLDVLNKEKLRADKSNKSYNDNKLENMKDSSKDISDIRKEYKAIQNDIDMDSKEKRKKLDRLDADMNRIAKNSLRQSK